MVRWRNNPLPQEGVAQAMVTPDMEYSKTMALGETLSFDYWFETLAEPGSFEEGFNFDVLVVEASGATQFLGQVEAYYSSTGWESTVLDIPEELQAYRGSEGWDNETTLRFHLTDYDPETNPTLYFSNLQTDLPAEIYWVGESGSWDDPNNWSNTEGGPGGDGPPFIFDKKIYITQSDDIDRTVYFSGDYHSAFDFGPVLTIDATGTGNLTFSISDGTLSALDLFVGKEGSAIVNQSGGSINLQSSAEIWNTLYNMTDGELYGLYIEINDSVFYQSGGTFNSGVGSLDINNTTYNISDGWLESVDGSFHISNSTINQTGGRIYGTHYGIFITDSIYNLSEGNLESSAGIEINGGTFNLSGGSVSGSGPVALGITAGTFNQSGGEVTASGVDRGLLIGDNATYNLSGGSLVVSGGMESFRNDGQFNYAGGSLSASDQRDIINNGTTTLSGSGTRVVDGNVVNNGTWKTTNTTAEYTGTFTNNGAYISDPADQYFIDLIVTEAGYLVGQHNDQFYIGGDFISHSEMNYDWNTKHSYLGFIAGEDNLHDFYLTGYDYGATMSGYANNFSWGTLDVTDNNLTFYDGNSEEGAALYLRELMGLAISDELIANLFGFEGLNLYYMAQLPGNSYLGGLTYELAGGGYLRPAVPEPSTTLLLGTGLFVLLGFRRKFRS